MIFIVSVHGTKRSSTKIERFTHEALAIAHSLTLSDSRPSKLGVSGGNGHVLETGKSAYLADILGFIQD
jgi:hypothetical protein